MRSAKARAAACAVLAAHLGGAAVAAPPSRVPAKPSARPPEDTAERARILFRNGSDHYAAGSYAEAARLFGAAYELSRAPGLLFNIAQAHRMRGTEGCEDALSAYERYRDLDRTLSNRAELQERIAEMRGCVDAKRASAQALAAPPPVAAPSAPPPSVAAAPPLSAPAAPAAALVAPRQRQSAVAPAVLAATGVAVGLGGGFLYWRARVKFGEAERTAPHPEGTYDGWQRATWASYGLMGVGGAAAVAGLMWWRARGADVALVPAPAGVSVAGRF